MFRALDGQARVKAIPSGSNFSNPLAVANGGTGLVQISDGELYIPTVASVMNRLARSTKPNRCLSKEAAEVSPTWKSLATLLAAYYLPQTASRPMTAPRVFHYSATNFGGVGVTCYGGNNIVLAGTGTASDGSDATATFLRFTTGAVSGNIAGANFDVAGVGSNGQTEITSEMLFGCKFRTGSDITSVRIQVGYGNAYPANSDAQANRGVGIQYSTVRGDAAWQINYGDNSVATQILVSSGVSIVASTAYTLTIRVYTNDGVNFLADVTLNGTLVTVAVPVAFSSSGLNGATGYIGVVTQTTAARVIDLQRMFVVVRHADQQY